MPGSFVGVGVATTVSLALNVVTLILSSVLVGVTVKALLVPSLVSEMDSGAVAIVSVMDGWSVTDAVGVSTMLDMAIVAVSGVPIFGIFSRIASSIFVLIKPEIEYSATVLLVNNLPVGPDLTKDDLLLSNL